jgi:type IV pilus assembly protein PilA
MTSPPPIPGPASTAKASHRGGLSGCAIAAIVAGGLFIVLIPIVGILAAIAIPQYQDYVHRSKVAEGLSGVRSLLFTIETYAEQNGACPDNAALGLGAGDDGRFGKAVSSVLAGAAPDGACQIELHFDTIPPVGQAESILIYRKNSDGWDCTGGSLAQRYRPNHCRATPR